MGLGAVGARSARQLLSSKAVDELVVFSRDPAKAGTRLAALGGGGALSSGAVNGACLLPSPAGAAVTLLTAPGPWPLGGRGQLGSRSAGRFHLGRPARSAFIAHA